MLFLKFIRYFSIYQVPQLLVSANILRGVDATSFPRLSVDSMKTNSNYIDEAVVINNLGIVSSRISDDLPQLNEAIIESLANL